MNRLSWILMLGLLAASMAVSADRALSEPDPQTPQQTLQQSYLEAFKAPQTPAATATDQKQLSELRELIENINSMSLPQNRASNTAEPTLEIEKPQPNTQPVKPATVLTPAVVVQPKMMTSALSPDVLDRLGKKSATEVADPLQLANALYHGGHGLQARTFYEKALAETQDETFRAWLVYRLGQCARQDGPNEAITRFRQVLAEYPDSIWAPLADVQLTILQDQQAGKTEALLEVVRKEIEQLEPTERRTVKPKLSPLVRPQVEPSNAAPGTAQPPATPQPPAQPQKAEILP